MRSALFNAYKTTHESLAPLVTTSSFKNDARLTPQEFEVAGDFLVRTFPTWSWEAGDPSKAKPYLPKDKQYLITRNVPCHQRAAAVEGYVSKPEEVVEGGEGDEEGWVAPESSATAGPSGEEDIPDLDGNTAAAADRAGGAAEGDSDDDVPDIDDLEIDDEEQDEAALPQTSRYLTASEGPSNIVRTRTYDLLITYDKYHRVPMTWLVGYDENRQPLPANKILQDVSEEHARKTATVDPFPHASMMAVGIHPCKHADVMKKFIDMSTGDSGREFIVEHYMVLFLKFIASVVPTIQYDHTSSTF